MADGQQGGSFSSGFFGTVADFLGNRIKQQRDNDQKLKDEQAQVYLDAIRSGNLSPDQIAYSQQQLQKIYGNSKPLKELFQKMGQVIGIGHKVTGQAQGQGGGQAADPNAGWGPGGNPLNPAWGGSPGGAQPMSEATPIGGSSTQPPGTSAARMGTPPAGAPPPPPTFASIATAGFPSKAAEAGAEYAAQYGAKNEADRAAMQQRYDFATNMLGMQPKTAEFNEYVATGKWPSVLHYQKGTMMTKDGHTTIFDPESGKTLDSVTGQEVQADDLVPTSSLTPKQVFMTGADGVDRPYWIKGENIFHADGTPVSEDELGQLQRMHPSLVPKTTISTTQHLDTATGLLYNTTSSKTTTPVMSGSSSGKTPAGAPPAPPKRSSTKPAATRPAASSGGNAPDTMAAIQQAHQLKLMTGTTRTMIETAPKVEDLATRVRTLVMQQQSQLGPAIGRWNEFMTGKVGAPNAQFAALRTDTGLLQTLLMRMHVGARGGEYIMQSFKELLDAGKDSPENMLAALDEIQAYAKEVANEQVPTVMPAAGTPNAPAAKAPASGPPAPPKARMNADQYLQSIGVPQ